MSNKLCALLLHILIILSFGTLESKAEVWRCGKVYTSSPEKHKNCMPIEGSKICGTEGNKYFAPRKMSGSVDEQCPVTGRSKSPFVNLEDYKNYGHKIKKEDANSPRR